MSDVKRLVVYYSLSGNTEKDAKYVAEKLGCDLVKLETKKAMPKSFAAQILVGGGQVAFKHIPKLQDMNVKFSDYDQIILGTPVWNGKCVPAVNALLQMEDVADKITAVLVQSGGGDIAKCLDDLKGKLQNLQTSVSLLDPKNQDAEKNTAELDKFIEALS